MSTAIRKNTEKITMAACTLSFFNNVLNFFIHRHFLVSKKVVKYSHGTGDYETRFFSVSSKGRKIANLRNLCVGRIFTKIFFISWSNFLLEPYMQPEARYSGLLIYAPGHLL